MKYPWVVRNSCAFSAEGSDTGTDALHLFVIP